jgi:hypothetical protein
LGDVIRVGFGVLRWTVFGGLSVIAMMSAVLGVRAVAAVDGLIETTFASTMARAWRFSGFPIVAWWGPPGTASRLDFEAYRDAGFTLHATNPDQGFDRALTHVEAVGLRSLVFRQHQGFALEPLSDPEFPEDRDGVVGWIVADEPAGHSEVARSLRAVNALMREDPTRWTFFNLLAPHAQREPPTDVVIDVAVRASMPVLSYDSYVIMRDGTDRTDRFYAQLDQFRRASLRYGVPFWAFALTIGHHNYRRPSESDLRWQQYSNLAYGAKGLWYFTYWGPTDWKGWDSRAIVDPQDGARTDLYPWVQALNRAVLEMGHLLLRLTSVDVVHSRPPAGQRRFEPGRFWITDLKARDALVGFFAAPDGVAYALVVNKLHGMGKSARDTADMIELTFSDCVKKVEAVNWLDGVPGPLSSTGGGASLTLQGGTGVLLKGEVCGSNSAGDR